MTATPTTAPIEMPAIAPFDSSPLLVEDGVDVSGEAEPACAVLNVGIGVDVGAGDDSVNEEGVDIVLVIWVLFSRGYRAYVWT